MEMGLHLVDTREQLTQNELDALDDAMDKMLHALKSRSVSALRNDRLAMVEQAIGDFIIASRGLR